MTIRPFRLLPLASFVPGLVLALGAACDGCTTAAAPCDDDGDCPDGDVCVVAAGAGTCRPPGAEGEGEAGEGEGEGEGEGGEGEGEGEGEGPSCGNGVVDGTDTCDDGNDDEVDGCRSDCTPTAARVEALLGAAPPGEQPIGLPTAVAVAGDALYVGDDARVLATRLDDAGAVDAPWLRVSRRDGTRDVANGFDLAGVPVSLAADDEGTVYWAPLIGDQVLVQRGAGDPDVLLGGGSVDFDFDPPDYVYAEGPLELDFGRALSVDVTPAGVVFALVDASTNIDQPPSASTRLLALEDGVVRVIAGGAGATPATPAQLANLQGAEDIAVGVDATGAATHVWVVGRDRNARKITLADGSFDEVAGDGANCDTGPLGQCGVSARLVEDDGAGGYFAFIDINGFGVLHVRPAEDAVRRIAGASTSATGLASRAAADARDVLLGPLELAYHAPSDALFVVDDVAKAVARLDGATAGGVVPLAVVANNTTPAPERGTDRSFGVIEAVSLADDAVFFATQTALWRVALDDLAASLVLEAVDAGPCAVFARGFGGFAEHIAVTDDGETVFFADRGTPRVCRLDAPSGTVTTFLDDADGLTGVFGLDVIDGDGELWVLDDALRRFSVANGTALPDVATAVGVIDDFDARSLCNYAYAAGDDLHASTCSSGAEALVPGAPAEIDAVGMTELESVLAFGDSQIHDVSSGVVLAGTGPGFADGSVSDARFQRLEDMDVGDDFMVAVASSSAVRLVLNPARPDLDVALVAGSDRRTDDGRFAEARLFHPLSLSCTAARCVAAEPRLGTFRALDLAAARVDRVLGGDGAPASPPVGPVAMIDDDTFAWPDEAGGIVSYTLGAAATEPLRAPGELFEEVSVLRVLDVVDGEPSLFAARSGGVASFTGDGFVRSGEVSDRSINGFAAGPKVDAPAPWFGWLVNDGTAIVRLDLNAPDLAPLVVAESTDALGRVAVDAGGNLLLETEGGVARLDVEDGEIAPGQIAGAPATLPVILPFGDPLLPHPCRLLLERAGEAVLVADTCTGAVVELVVE